MQDTAHVELSAAMRCTIKVAAFCTPYAAIGSLPLRNTKKVRGVTLTQAFPRSPGRPDPKARISALSAEKI